MADQLVPQCGQQMQAGKREQPIGQVSVDVFRRVENRAVALDPEVHLEEAEIEHPAVK